MVITGTVTGYGVTSNDTGTSSIKCHSVKETIKETLKESEHPKNPVDEVLEIWTPDLNSLNAWLQRSGEMAMTQELVNELLLEVNAYYENRFNAGLITNNQMYSNFVKWVKRDSKKIRERVTTKAQPQIPQNIVEDLGDW